MPRELHGPGITLRLLVESEEVLEMEASYAGTGAIPPPHRHPSQTERFEVLSGTIHAIVDGLEARYAGPGFLEEFAEEIRLVPPRA